MGTGNSITTNFCGHKAAEGGRGLPEGQANTGKVNVPAYILPRLGIVQFNWCRTIGNIGGRD